MKLTERLDSLSGQISGIKDPFELNFRKSAWDQHLQLGWPNLKTESWHYTNSKGLLQSESPMAESSGALSADIEAMIAHWRATFLVVVLKNGQLVGSVDSSVSNLQSAWAKLCDLDIKWTDGLVSALAAQNQGGVAIEIAGNESTSRPIMIVHVSEGQKAVSSDLNFINLSPGVEASVVEVFLGGGEAQQFSQTFINLCEGATLQYGRLLKQQSAFQHLSEVQITLQKQAQLKALSVNLGLEWSRSSLLATMKGESSEALLSGIGFGLLQQHNDQRVEARHLTGNTKSRQLYKGIWRDGARGVLNGKIYIAKGANQVDSAQLNHNLLLSSHAEVDTKPELEVYADDVKANHGASIGRLDEEKLFYFLSRGISRSEATQILAEGFVSDVVAKVDSSIIKNLMTEEIRNVLPLYSSGLSAGGVQ